MITEMKMSEMDQVAAAGRKARPRKRPTSRPNIKNARYEEYPRNDRPYDVGYPFWHWEW
ncbi:MAG: hypothetical protein QGH37_28635 [Candidatus Poribacteria bacterium]|jgi:hypothetical protein|nr:hypothetical protein [Candidatus Poribacteria bacterium]